MTTGSGDTGARERLIEALVEKVTVRLDYPEDGELQGYREAVEALANIAALAAGVGRARSAEPPRQDEMDLVSAPVGAREGIAMVYSPQGRYLGCLGVEHWKRLVEAEASGASAPLAALTEEFTGLREQLDAADEALMQLYADVVGLSMAGWDSERRRLGEEALVRITAARAALGVVDAPAEPQEPHA